MNLETIETDLLKAMQERKVPEQDWDGLVDHVMIGRKVGSFLTAVLENDLMGACQCADSMNQRALFDLADVLYNYTPAGCHGSPEKVGAWRERRGLKGPTGC